MSAPYVSAPYVSAPHALRVLFVVHHAMDRNAGVGGATLSLHDAMRALGHEVHTYGYQDAFPDGPPKGHRLLFPWRVAAFLKREGHRYDVVDATSGDAWVWLARRSEGPRTEGPRIVTRAHGLEHTAHQALADHMALEGTPLSVGYRLYSGWYRLWEVEQSVRHADGVVMLNARDAHITRTRWHVPPERVLVSHNAVSDVLRALPAPTRASSDARPLRLAFVGSWIPRKGIACIAAVVEALLDRGIAFELDLLGTGLPADRVLADITPRAHHLIRVRPRYDQRELSSLLHDCHLLLHPSWAEGFSIGLVEGMACGLAPLATDSGASRELLATAAAGVFIDPPSVEAFVAAISALNGDRARLHTLRCGAHALATDTSWDQIARTTIEFYRSLGPARR